MSPGRRNNKQKQKNAQHTHTHTQKHIDAHVFFLFDSFFFVVIKITIARFNLKQKEQKKNQITECELVKKKKGTLTFGCF